MHFHIGAIAAFAVFFCSPVSAKEASKWETWPADVLEREYVSALEEKFGGAGAPAEDKIMLNYIAYVQKRDSKAGEKFITEWKKLVASRKAPLVSPSLSLFEGSVDRCWPAAFTSRKYCSQSIGTLTTKHLPRLVKQKDRPAMELIALYPLLNGRVDGAEAEVYRDFLKDWAGSLRYEKELDKIRNANSHLKPGPIVAN